MNRYLAILLLVLLFLGLVHSTYSFYKGRFGEGMLLFPLLAGCYVLFLSREKQEQKHEQQQPEEDHNGQDGPQD